MERVPLETDEYCDRTRPCHNDMDLSAARVQQVQGKGSATMSLPEALLGFLKFDTAKQQIRLSSTLPLKFARHSFGYRRLPKTTFSEFATCDVALGFFVL
jgi:hypothetical protein